MDRRFELKQLTHRVAEFNAVKEVRTDSERDANWESAQRSLEIAKLIIEKQTLMKSFGFEVLREAAFLLSELGEKPTITITPDTKVKELHKPTLTLMWGVEEVPNMTSSWDPYDQLKRYYTWKEVVVSQSDGKYNINGKLYPQGVIMDSEEYNKKVVEGFDKAIQNPHQIPRQQYDHNHEDVLVVYK